MKEHGVQRGPQRDGECEKKIGIVCVGEKVRWYISSTLTSSTKNFCTRPPHYSFPALILLLVHYSSLLVEGKWREGKSLNVSKEVPGAKERGQ